MKATAFEFKPTSTTFTPSSNAFTPNNIGNSFVPSAMGQPNPQMGYNPNMNMQQ